MNNVLLIGNKSFTTSVMAQVRGLNALTVTVIATAIEAAQRMEELTPDVVIAQASQLVEGSVSKTFSQERQSTYFLVVEESGLYAADDLTTSPFSELYLEKTAGAIESGADAYLWLPAESDASASIEAVRKIQAALEISKKMPALNQPARRASDRARVKGEAPAKKRRASDSPKGVSTTEAAVAHLAKQPEHLISFHQSQCRLMQAYIQMGLNQAQRYRDLSRINDWLSAVALVDALTQLSNRRAFDLELPRQIKVARSKGHSLSIMVLDIDYFKSVNDRYGHLVGDDVLKMLAKRLLSNMRFYDAPFRYGGEEFVITLNNTDLQEGILIAERLRKSIANTPFELASISAEAELPLTVSIGLAELRAEDDAKGRSFLHRADHCLLKAKATGRNRVETVPAESNKPAAGKDRRNRKD